MVGSMELGLHSIADKVVFGRAPTCDVVLEHLSISRQHATLSTDTAGNLFITDLGSGAMLNRLQLPGLPLLEQLRVAEVMSSHGKHQGFCIGNPRVLSHSLTPMPERVSSGVPILGPLCHTMIKVP